MVVAGIAAIRLEVIKSYWIVLIILGTVGLTATFAYNHFVADRLFPEYKREQFLMMYGMLTGTASTGIILLREVDYKFTTPASDNMVYQNFPAIVFGFPLMFLASFAPKNPPLALLLLFISFVIINILLFRKKIFGTKSGT
jgi:ESS family glutamate:Na+ symporter